MYPSLPLKRDVIYWWIHGWNVVFVTEPGPITLPKVLHRVAWPVLIPGKITQPGDCFSEECCLAARDAVMVRGFHVIARIVKFLGRNRIISTCLTEVSTAFRKLQLSNSNKHGFWPWPKSTGNLWNGIHAHAPICYRNPEIIWTTRGEDTVSLQPSVHTKHH